MDSLLFHPKVVHVPIALSLLMPIIAAAVATAWWRGWLPPRGWALVIALQAVLLGSGLLALETGEAEEERVEHAVPEALLEAHEEAAEVFVWASGAVLGVMLLPLAMSRGRGGLPMASVALASTLAVLALGYRVGHAGGELVYRHDAARVYAGPGAAPETLRHPSHEEDDE